MAQLQTMAGRPVAPPITTVQGGAVRLKLIPASGERLPLTVTTTSPMVADIKELNNRTQANFTTFTLRGETLGQTLLVVRSANNVATPPTVVRVIARIDLPSDSTNAGLLARLFLAETPGPASSDSREAMTLMRVVVENRLAAPSGRWASAGVRTMGDVVRAPGQFEGFSGYPTLSKGVSGRIDDMLRIANDASDGRQAATRAHIEQAIEVASGPRPTDPTSTGLYWWRTAKQGAPGNNISVYKTLLGNTFYREGPK